MTDLRPGAATPNSTVRATVEELDRIAREGGLPIYALVTNARPGDVGRATVPLSELTDADLSELVGIEVSVVYESRRAMIAGRTGGAEIGDVR
jgi:hypothetical protein